MTVAALSTGSALAYGETAETIDSATEQPTRSGNGGTPVSGESGTADAPTQPEATSDRSADSDRRRRRVKLIRNDARPSKAWFKGRAATFRYAIGGSRARDLVVQVKRRREPKIVRRYRLEDVPPKVTRELDWNGKVDGNRKYARQGAYKFRVRELGGRAADATGAEGRPRSGFYKHKFPVRGRHSYGDGIGAGRGHRGVDVFAKCGTKLQAARAGRVQWKAYQSAAGHYLVIDGKGTNKDYVYMHLRRASRLSEGDRVKTGQKIGAVGESGNARGCHLHFEMWRGGWYEGGTHIDPMPKLKRWDRWS